MEISMNFCWVCNKLLKIDEKGNLCRDERCSFRKDLDCKDCSFQTPEMVLWLGEKKFKESKIKFTEIELMHGGRIFINLSLVSGIEIISSAELVLYFGAPIIDGGIRCKATPELLSECEGLGL